MKNQYKSGVSICEKKYKQSKYNFFEPITMTTLKYHTGIITMTTL